MFTCFSFISICCLLYPLCSTPKIKLTASVLVEYFLRNVYKMFGTLFQSYCLKVKEMDDEEYSYAALQEPLYRVETGNYEYRYSPSIFFFIL